MQSPGKSSKTELILGSHLVGGVGGAWEESQKKRELAGLEGWLSWMLSQSIKS